MNLVHIHLLLNHWPIIGSFIALGLFLVALIANSDDLKQASLALFGFLALFAIPTYMSGNVAYEVIKGTAGISQMTVQAHEGIALLSLTFMLITGGVALIGLWQYSRMSHPTPRSAARWNVPAVLVLAIITASLMAIAGNTGGAIRHPEILSGQEAVSSFGMTATKFVSATSYFSTGYSRWVWPILETLHFLGLILIVAAIGGLNLRLLGFWREVPVAPLHRLLPWGIFGFVINIVTGMLFFVGMPFFYAFNLTMYLKMGAMVLAGFTLILFNCTSAFRGWSRLGPSENPPAFAKFVAASSLVLWTAIIILGRYIPLTQDGLK
jgi:hypothetical protein